MRLRVSSDWDWMSTCDSLGQPYRSRCANLGQAVGGDMTALLMFTDPLSSCNNDNRDSKHDDDDDTRIPQNNDNDNDKENENRNNTDNDDENDLALSSA